MKKFSKLIIILGLLFGTGYLIVTPGLAQEPPPSTADFVPGEILVKFQPHVNIHGAQRSLRSLDMKVAGVSPHSGVVRLQVEPGHEQKMINELLARGDVEYAAVNRHVHATFIPNDTYYGSQWALTKIEAPAAWDISTGGSNITIAILDSGVDLDHPDLQANIVPGYDYVYEDSIPNDTYSHGTHVAGIAAGIGNNSIGIAGVSWSAKIMPVQVLDNGGGGNEDDVAEGIYHAVSNGAQIINLSLGGSRFDSDTGQFLTCEQRFPTMSNAIQTALDNGVLVVAASGNAYGPVYCPAAIDGVIAVGSTNRYDGRPSYSNYGPELDIAAPGGDSYDIDSTMPGGGYGGKHGTSMATPYVSGLAALLWSMAPSLTDEQVFDLIKDNAVDLGATGWDQYFGHGRINAGQTFQAMSLDSTPSQLTLFVDDERSSSTGNVQVVTVNPNVITWTATISPNVPWLTISSSDSGTISATSSPSDVTLVASSAPITYSDTPTTTTLVISGTTSSGATVTASSDIQLIFQSDVYEYYFPLVFKY